MSLEVSRVDHSGREALELHGGLVSVEEIHAACGDGERRPPSAPTPHPGEVSPNPHPHRPPPHTQVLPEL